MNTDSIVGEQIKTGSPGRSPRIEIAFWRGTAEVIGVAGAFRVPAAIVVCDKAQRRAVIQLSGNEQEFGRWWEADLVRSREWEDETGSLVEGDVAAEIDSLLSKNQSWSCELARIALHDRFLSGKYSISEGAS